MDINNISELLDKADAVVIGAGAGLSTSAGFTYSGKRFDRYFSDFSKVYGFGDMYSGGFTDFENLETYWAYWSRYIYINRYMNPSSDLYKKLFELVKDTNYFVLTTNVDHCFINAGFDKKRLFYTQGDYGLFQCSIPCHQKTYDNKQAVLDMIKSQNIIFADKDEYGNDDLIIGYNAKMSVAEDLVPRCPECRKPMTMNLRADNTFVQDKGWYKASANYERFISRYKDSHIVYLELGVGGNTPGIIKYPFWRLTYDNPKAAYVCINKGEAVCPNEIEKQSICINMDIKEAIDKIRSAAQ